MLLSAEAGKPKAAEPKNKPRDSELSMLVSKLKQKGSIETETQDGPKKKKPKSKN